MKTLAILAIAIVAMKGCGEDSRPPRPRFIVIDNGPIYRPGVKQTPTPTPTPTPHR